MRGVVVVRGRDRAYGKIVESLRGDSGPRLGSRNIRVINKDLDIISREYYRQVPLDLIFRTLEKHGLIVLQEDETRWSGFVSGRRGRETFQVADRATERVDGSYMPYDNTMLVLTWYQMETRRFEIVVYLS